MSVNLVSRTVGALLVAGISVMIATPIMYSLYSNNQLWDMCNNITQCLTIKGNTYTVFQYLALPLLGVVILGAFMAASRRQQNEYDD